jgi:hypothetical protein
MWVCFAAYCKQIEIFHLTEPQNKSPNSNHAKPSKLNWSMPHADRQFQQKMLQTAIKSHLMMKCIL